MLWKQSTLHADNHIFAPIKNDIKILKKERYLITCHFKTYTTSKKTIFLPFQLFDNKSYIRPHVDHTLKEGTPKSRKCQCLCVCVCLCVCAHACVCLSM